MGISDGANLFTMSARPIDCYRKDEFFFVAEYFCSMTGFDFEQCQEHFGSKWLHNLETFECGNEFNLVALEQNNVSDLVNGILVMNTCSSNRTDMSHSHT